MNNRDKVLLTTMGLLMENDSPDYKKIFQDYCKDKIADLGTIDLPDAIWGDEEINTWDIIMTADEIRQFTDLRIINKEELNEDDNLIAIDKENNIVFNTPMITSLGYAARMEFKQIDKEYYNNILLNWDYINFDEMMEGYAEESENLKEDYYSYVSDFDDETYVFKGMIKTFNVTDYGSHNNDDTIYGELLDGNWYEWIPEWEKLDIYDAPITTKYLDTAYNYDTDDERADDKWYDQFQKEHKITDRYDKETLDNLVMELYCKYYKIPVQKVEENKQLNEYYEGTDFEDYTRLVNEIKLQAEENGYNLTDDDIEKLADKMVTIDNFFYDYELPNPDDIDNEDWEEIHKVINDYLKSSKIEESNEVNQVNYDIEYVIPNYTGGGIYEYIGKLTDGNYFMAFDDYFNADNSMFDIRIVDTNPEDVPEEYGYADWQDLHIVRDLNEVEAKEFTIKVLNWIINNVPDGNYDINDMKGMLEVIYN